MLAISPDMPRAALSAKDPGRPHVPHSDNRRDTPIMAHPLPDHSTVPAAELQYLHGQMMQLTARVGLALDAAGIDVTGATPPRPLPVQGNVFDLVAYRLHRHGGAA